MKSLNVRDLTQLFDISGNYSYGHNSMFVLLYESKKCAYCSNGVEGFRLICKKCDWKSENPDHYLVIDN